MLRQLNLSLATFAASIDALVKQINSDIAAGRAFPIQIFFDRLPLNPATLAAKLRIIKRGDIAVNGRVLSNSAPNGRDTSATFNDDQLGRVDIVIPAKLTAAQEGPDGGATAFRFADTQVIVNLFLKTTIPYIDGPYQCTNIEHVAGKSITYKFKDTVAGGDDLEIVGDLTAKVSTQQAASAPESLGPLTQEAALSRVESAAAAGAGDLSFACGCTCDDKPAWWVVDKGIFGGVQVEYGTSVVGTQLCSPCGTKAQAENAADYYRKNGRCPPFGR